jgi:membrane fusion protein (multidrug efflux system)
MNKDRNIGLVLFTSIITLLILSGCTSKKSEENNSIQTAIVPVKITAIKTGEIDEPVQANGQTEALQKESLVSPVAGRVSHLIAQEGQRVQVGDTLVVILTRESISALEGAQALINRAESPEQKAEAEKALRLARSNQNIVAIRSQIPGVVAARNVVEGTMVAEGAELLTIVDPQSINFAAQVPLTNLGRVAIGQVAIINLTSAPEKPLQALVNSINPQADTANQTARVLLRLNDITMTGGYNLENGTAGVAKIVVGEHKNVMIVPLAAVLRNDETNRYSVVTVTPDSLSKTISVKTGITRDSTMEISSPDLHEGMPVIIEGHYSLADSTRVSTRR